MKETQQEHADRFGVSLYQYRMWEKGEVTPPVKAELKGPLKPHEKCVIARVRSNKTIRQLARELNNCRWWVQQMERGLQPCDRLMEYWGLS